MNDLYQTYAEAIKGKSLPLLYVDEAALDKNIDWVVKNHGGKKIRIATKSVRSVEILRHILKASPIFQGLMTFTLKEALWLRSLGFKDILMGYPTTDPEALSELAKDPTEIILMVDLPEHIELLKKFNATFNICLDLDLSLDLPFVRFGVFRSRITNLERLRAMLDVIEKSTWVKLQGTMGYEAQIAGVMDKSSFLMRFLKKISVKHLRKRRTEMMAEIKNRGIKLPLVNGGGTGSLSLTNQEDVVTEVTVGSGFFAPVLFDHYESFTLSPAMGFALPIVRNPEENIYTCLGGGYIASGETQLIKTPTPYLPEGLSLLKHEGAGEVQTPLKYTGAEKLSIGDPVFMRHAKAGEVCERFNHIHVLRDGKISRVVSTYRGDGQAFL